MSSSQGNSSYIEMKLATICSLPTNKETYVHKNFCEFAGKGFGEE
jgi:hypothetical protein